MGRDKKITCGKCLRVMRRDNLKRHMNQHEKEKFEKEYFCGSSIGTSKSSLQESESDFSLNTTNKTFEVSTLEREEMTKRLIKDDEEYKYKVERGKQIYEEVGKYGIKEESLCSEYKELLEMYMKQRKNIDVDNVILRCWQESLLQYLKPSNREIIWVQGAKCNEGKSWFQEFIEAKFGWERVMCGLDIKMKKESIYHLIRRRPYMTTDVFTFNIGKADTYEDVNYQVLEQLKDGRILAAKFSSKEIKICTPNIVIVFSNDKPKLAKLAMDRWKIFKIKEDDLIDVSPNL